MLHEDRESSLNCTSSFETSSGTKIKEAKRLNNENFVNVNTSQCKNGMLLSPSAFRVYDKISQKNRYVPRKWTQEEFEAALPQRFKEGSKTRAAQRNTVIYLAPKEKEDKESDLKKDVQHVLPHSQNKLLTDNTAACQYRRKRTKINEKISNLKLIFEGVKNEGFSDQFTSKEKVSELASCQKSENKFTMLNGQGEKVNINYGKNDGVKWEESASETTRSSPDTRTTFVDSCLQCLLNIEQIVQFVSNMRLTSSTGSSIDIGKLENLLKTVHSSDKPTSKKLWHLCLRNVFHKLYEEVSTQSQSCDEALQVLLEAFVYEISGQDRRNLRSVFQGKFCHSRICEQCETVVREYQPFMFLNPTLPPTSSPKNRTLDISLLSCKDAVWRVTSHEILVYPGMTVADLKEELAKYPEFLDQCEISAIKIGEVKNSRMEVFDDTEDIWELRVDPTSSIFVFNVINYQSELTDTNKQDKNYTETTKLKSAANMSYHLYFSCGLCLNDGKEVGLLMHGSCGGMVCRDCLDEISQTQREWELCPCPICERPIDLDKEFCSMKINAGAEGNEMHPGVPCGVVFRVDKPCNEGTELFGCPVFVSFPQKTTGYHLYRCIGYLLPRALPMKDKTSFTLHKVDKSGVQCGTCCRADCTGCLIRIDDSITIAPDTCLAVHFDNIDEESKNDFGIIFRGIPHTFETRMLFDGILQSCMDSSSFKQALCPKCFHVSKTTSSISEFPQLLIMHLNRQFASKGLPASMTIADVTKFFILERENEFQGEAKQSLTYQLMSAVLKESHGLVPTYKVCVPGSGANHWLFYDDLQVEERHPALLHLTSDSVLFYELVSDCTTTPSESTRIGQIHELQSAADDGKEIVNKINDSTRPKRLSCSDLHKVNRLYTILEGQATRHNPQKTYDCRKSDKKQDLDHYTLKACNSRFEPGECFPGKDLGLRENQPFQQSCWSGSQVSLGEIRAKRHFPSKRIAAAVLDGIDTISPIATTNVLKSDNRIIKETEKLVKAVKREDAYNIVCSLKRGADPCLLIDDVSALHLAVGIKSDQRRSMVNYLLNYCGDVNVRTTDGTTPTHVAAAWGHQDALELLMEHGGDPFDLTDFDGNSAFDLASKDCSTYLQSIFNRQQNSTLSELSSNSYASLPTNLSNFRAPKHMDHVGHKGKRLEDIVRSNVGLPSFVEGNTCNAPVHRRWLRGRLRSIRKRSTGLLRRLRKMGSIRRRSRIGVAFSEVPRSISSKM